MSDGWKAIVNGFLVMAAVAIVLLLIDGPTGRNLIASLVLGAIVMIGSALYYRRV